MAMSGKAWACLSHVKLPGRENACLGRQRQRQRLGAEGEAWQAGKWAGWGSEAERGKPVPKGNTFQCAVHVQATRLQAARAQCLVSLSSQKVVWGMPILGVKERQTVCVGWVGVCP